MQHYDPLDNSVKNRLAHLEVPFQPQHWEELERMLNNLPVGNQFDMDAVFDATIKQKIQQPAIPPAPYAWAGIEQGLDEAIAADQQFDAAINEKIKTFSNTATSDWASMESALDQAEKLEKVFDNQIANSLRGIKPTYQPSHWQKLLNLLTRQDITKENLYRYKLMELALMVLFLLNCYQYLPENHPIDWKQKIARVPALITEKLNNATPANNNDEKLTDNSPATPKDSKQTPLSGSPASSVVATTPTTTNRTDNQQLQTLTRIAISRHQDNLTAAEPLPLLKNNALDNNRLTISISEMNDHLRQHTMSGSNLIEAVPSLRPVFVESQQINPSPLDCENCKRMRIPASLRLGLISNFAINNAYRSGQILNINSLNQRGFGYGLGATLGFKYGRWELETGLGYAAKNYDPNIVQNESNTGSGDFRRTHFKAIHLQTLHAPVNLRFNYAVLGKGRWHLYSQAGASLNLILRAEHDLADVSNSRSPSNASITSRLSVVEFDKGILAGGDFADNRYLALQIGMGVEHYISPRWSVFFQPDFQFHFSDNRIGPTQDRINTLRFNFGARKSL